MTKSSLIVRLYFIVCAYLYALLLDVVIRIYRQLSLIYNSFIVTWSFGGHISGHAQVMGSQLSKKEKELLSKNMEGMVLKAFGSLVGGTRFCFFILGFCFFFKLQLVVAV